MSWKDVLSVTVFGDSILTIKFGWIAILLIVVWFAFIFISRRRWKTLFDIWRVEKANIKLGGVGEVEIRPDYEDMQIAHKAWVELTTRKAGLPFDEEHDVIVEVYDSWYKLFGEMRDLTKQIPAYKIRNSKDTQELVSLLIDALNKGLRPYLTKWQARFRRWYEKELNKHQNKSPQEIQLLYPKCDEMLKELKEVNKQMVQYTEFIKRIAHGE